MLKLFNLILVILCFLSAAQATPLLLDSARNREWQKVKRMVTSCKADVNFRDQNGYTVLHEAVIQLNFKALEMLLCELNADPDGNVLLELRKKHPDHEHLFTPLHIIVGSRIVFTALRDQKEAIIMLKIGKFLLDNGASPHIKNEIGSTVYSMVDEHRTMFIPWLYLVKAFNPY